MIFAVCLNPALDLTYRVDSVVIGQSHPAQVVAERAGGKGINVATVLHQMGVPTEVTGLVGGPYGSRIDAELRRLGLRTCFTPIASSTRRSVAVVGEGDVTVFNELGPDVTGAEWRAFVSCFESLVGETDVVTLSGSTPPGLPDDCYATLTRIARAVGTAVVLDASGPALECALAEGPSVVAPNRAEAAHTLGRAISSQDDVVEACEAIRAAGAESVVISSGFAGLMAHTPVGVWVGRPARIVAGNPTGAGDAATAALAYGLTKSMSWPDMLRTAIAWAGGAVATEHAGEVDEVVADELFGTALVEEIA